MEPKTESLERSFIKDLEVLEDREEKNITIIPNKVKHKEAITYLTKEEILERLAKVPQEKLMIFQFLWRTGIRVSELIAITKRDIDFEANTIKIKWLKNRKYLYRTIPLHKSLKFPLYQYTANLNLEDRVFPYTRQYVDQLHKKYNLGHAHLLRNSFAVNFLKQKANPWALRILQTILGHNQITTTMQYLKAVPNDQAEALEGVSFD